MNKRKLLTIFLVLVIIISLAFGLLGLFLSKKVEEEPKDEYEITYIYYLNDNQKLDKLPQNTEEETYIFDKYICTNKITGKWNKDEWKFIPSNNKSGTCKLYFKSNKYLVTLNLINASVDEEINTHVSKGLDGTFPITPNEGYTFEKVECTNKEEYLWDEENSELIIKNIKKDTTCDVSFVLKEYTIKVIVNNGSGAITRNDILHKTEFTTTIIPSSGYGDPTINCNNDQTGSWSNTTFKITSVENNTECTIDFKYLQGIPSYQVSLSISEHGSYAGPVYVQSGQNAQFLVIPTSGYIVGTVTGCSNHVVNGNYVTITNVTKNTTCTVNMIEET